MGDEIKHLGLAHVGIVALDEGVGIAGDPVEGIERLLGISLDIIHGGLGRDRLVRLDCIEAAQQQKIIRALEARRIGLENQLQILLGSGVILA